MNDATATSGRKEKRRKAIMEAAFQLFTTQGYNEVSMTDVIRRSGGSLATAYDLFENKDGLLRALLDEKMDMFRHTLQTVSAAAGPPEAALKAAARDFLGLLLDSNSVGMLRIIVSESQRNPCFREYFNSSTPEVSAKLLSKTFQRWHDEGALDVDDPLQAADSFFALLLHKIQMSALCCAPVSMTEAEKENHIDHVVRTICCRYRKQPAPS